MDNKLIAAVSVFAVLVFAGIAFAAQGWQNTATGKVATDATRINTTEHEQFQTAVETGDFAIAKSLHEQYGFGGNVFDSLNETSFAKFTQMHNAVQAGDSATAEQIRSELRANGEFDLGNGCGMNCAGCGMNARKQNTTGTKIGCQMRAGNTGTGNCPMRANAGAPGGCPYASNT